MKIELNKFKSPLAVQRLLQAIAILIIVLGIFQAGIFVGYRKAAFSYSLGDRYYRAFDHNNQKGPNPFDDKELLGGNGAVGAIIRVNLPTFVVSTPDNVEKIVRINDATLIRQFKDTASTTNLQVGQHVVVLGSPNTQAEIEAKLIRLLPPPPNENRDIQTGTSSRF